MALVQKEKTKRKKIKYFKFELRLSKPEKEIIAYYCTVKKTTPIKLIKNALRDFLKRNAADLKLPEVVEKNQMNIFDIINEGIEKAG